MVPSKKERKRDDSYAKLSFWLSLLSVIPLLGFFVNSISIIFGIMALYNIRKDPKAYGGTKWAIAGLVIDFTWIGLWIWALLFYPERIIGV